MEDKQETKLEIIDLENWMSNLPPRLRVLPLVYLAIPGTWVQIHLFDTEKQLLTICIHRNSRQHDIPYKS